MPTGFRWLFFTPSPMMCIGSGDERVVAESRVIEEMPMCTTRGIASIKLIVALPAILAFTWLGIEFGLLFRAVQQAKIASDAAALAAAARLPEDVKAFETAAVLAAAGNTGPGGGITIEAISDNAGGDLLTGLWDDDTRAFIPDSEAREAVRVRVRFGANAPNEAPGYVLPNLLELADITFERSSIATWNPRPASTSLLITRPTGGRALACSQTALLDSFGEIGVRSTGGQAVRLQHDAVVITPALRLAGGLNPGAADRVEGEIIFDVDVPQDPYAGVSPPGLLAPVIGPGEVGPGETVDLEPGRHPDGLELNGGTVRLLPGVHQFGGVGLILDDDARLILIEASIQLLDSAKLRVRGEAEMSGDAPLTGDWEDVLLLGGDANAALISEDASIIVPGVVYLPMGRVQVEDQGSVVIDGAIVERWQQLNQSNARLDRIILTGTEIGGGRARLRQ